MHLLAQAKPALDNAEAVTINVDIENANRTFGTMLSGRVAEKYGFTGLPEDTITINAKGTAGQSFAAWVTNGVTIKLSGEGNDYVGKGLSGGKLIITPPPECKIEKAEDNVIVGNTVLFGAIKGECYFNGVGGERFAVRNSGATAVVEGVGDHCCEYMTGGVVAVLGDTGRNFAAGMSGGMAYVLDANDDFEQRCNLAQVELESIPEDGGASDSDLEDMTRFDETRLKQMLKKHLEYTGSAVAKNILDNWSDFLPKFKKVMPVDYRRALVEMQDAQNSKSAA